MAILTEQKLEYPFRVSMIRKLKAGDRVRISGRLFTGRDRLHRYLVDGGKSPVDFKDGAVFHCGPIVVKTEAGWAVQASGPTTSARQDPYMADIIERFGVRMIIGKGGMGDKTRAACMKHNCIYLQTIGGAGALLAKHIVSVDGVHFLKEFGSADALWELTAADLPAMVAIDTTGKSLYRRIERSSRSALGDLLERRVRLD